MLLAQSHLTLRRSGTKKHKAGIKPALFYSPADGRAAGRAYSADWHFFMNAVLAAPASALPFLSIALASQLLPPA